MADASILKEFLVSVGFSVDHAKYKKTEEGLKKITKVVEGLGAAVAIAVAAVKLGVEEMSEELESLYFASQRIGSSVEDIKAFGYAVGQMGGNAKTAQAALESLAEAIRSNPSIEGLLNGMGVRTREGNGDLRGRVQIMRDLAKQLQGMDYRIAKQRAAQLGMDTNTLQALRRGDLDKYMSQYGGIAGNADMDKAAKGAHDFMNSMRELGAQFEVMAMLIAARWAPAVKVVAGLLTAIGKAMTWLDKVTDGWSTRIISLVATLGAMVAAAGFVTGGLEGVGAALVAAAGILGAPIALIVAAVAALGIAAYELIKHWDVVGPFFEKLWDRVVRAAEDGVRRVKAAVAALTHGTPSGGGKPVDTTLPPRAANQNAPGGFAGVFQAAQAASAKWGIPASVILGQWALESAKGSHMPAGSNNPFGIKATNGQPYVEAMTTEYVNGKSIREMQRVRKFGSLAEAFDAHAQLLATAPAYANARRYRNDPGRFADALTGVYATDPQYGQKLRNVMRNSGYLQGDPGRGRLGGQTVNVTQKTDIHVSGGDARHTAQAVAAEQDRVNGNMVRSLKGAVR